MSDQRDAFGREKGEDSLADMGWSSSVRPQPAPTAAPAPAPQPTFTAGDLPPNGPAPAWTPGPRQSHVRRRRSSLGFWIAFMVISFVALGVIGSFAAFKAGSDAIDGITSSIDAATPEVSTSRSRTPPDGTTLMNAKALRSALDKLPAGDIQLLRVAPDRINANINVDGKLHVVMVTAGGDVSDVTTPAGGQGDAVRVNPAAPARIVRTAAKRAGRRPSDVNYLVLMHLLGKDEWQLFFNDGTHYAGSASGKKVRKVG
jgi:hypothetical protein